jgi:phosphoribosylformylglycinamidine synthase
MYAKEPGDLIYVVGVTHNELGGSHYYDILGSLGNSVPKVNPKQAKETFGRLSKAASSGLIEAMHDCSEGGIGVAAAEMAFSGGLGMEIFLGEVPFMKSQIRNDLILFSESNSRFIVEVKRKNQKAFERTMKGSKTGLIGCVSEKKDFRVYGLDNKPCVDIGIAELKEAWQRPLGW